MFFVSLAASCAAKPALHRSTPPSKPAGTQLSGAYSNLKAIGTSSHIIYSDPKTGKLLWTADVAYSEAQSGQTQSDVTATLHDVHGKLYESGKPADRFAAPLVIADNAHHTVTATGGVTVTSITQAGTTLRCDKMTWYSGENKLIGVGHVVFKKGGITQTMPSFQADTRLRTIVSPAPGLARASRMPIHTHYAARPPQRK